MLLDTKEFKLKCSKILSALDNSNINPNITDTLELKTDGDTLFLNVTNTEYYISIKFKLNTIENFHATINAELFLKLISQTTSPTIELTLDQNSVNIKGNGNYKIPLIFENNNLMELPKINIINKTLETQIPNSILNSIMTYNTKEMIKENITKPIQTMYYIDEKGCITFTGTGACINEFNLTSPFRILLNTKVVKLFKLFKSDIIEFNLGYDSISDTIIQTKVKFFDNEVELSAILSCDDSLLNSIPVNAIRSKLNINYPYTVVLNKDLLNQALNRLVLFNKNNVNILQNYYNFTFNNTELIITDTNNINTEILLYQNGTNINQSYNMYLNINNFKNILDGCSDEYVNLLFGISGAVLIVRNNIKNILMENTKD